jgi:hypothetical protein
MGRLGCPGLGRKADQGERPAVPVGECLAGLWAGGVTGGRRPGRPCAATLSVASTTLRCEVVAYLPERRFPRKADTVWFRGPEASATGRPPPGQTGDTCSGRERPPGRTVGPPAWLERGGRSRPVCCIKREAGGGTLRRRTAEGASPWRRQLSDGVRVRVDWPVDNAPPGGSQPQRRRWLEGGQ